MLRKEERKAAGGRGERLAAPAFGRAARRSPRPRFSLPFIAGSFSVFSLVVSLFASAQSPTPLAKSVEVVITNVDVVVTDSKGKPVTDLGRADFEVKQDGVPQPITNFSLIDNGTLSAPGETPAPAAPAGPEAPPLPAAPRAHLVIFIDELHLTVTDKNRALKSLAEFLPKTLGPNVEAQIATWDRALRIRGTFINDATVLNKVLKSVEDETALGDLPLRARDALIQEFNAALATDPRFRQSMVNSAIANCRAWCDSQAHDVDATLDAARATLAQLAGVEGRKIMFFLTQRLAPSPGRELWDYVTQALQRPSGGSRGQQTWDANDLTWKTFDRSASFDGLAKSANAAGVSLVTIDGSGLTSDPSLSAEFGGFDDRVNDGMATMDAESALRFLADQTGGVAVVGRNNLALALERLEADWKTYYSLGFESEHPKPGEARRISVKVKRPGLAVRSRRAIVERTPEQKIADAVLSGVHFPKTYNPLHASLHVGTPAKSGKMYLVPLEFKIPFQKLTLIPDGSRARGRLLFTAAAATPDGRISEISTERAPIDVPRKELASLEGKAFTYTATLKVRPGPQVLSLALTDETSLQTSYVQPHVLIGDSPPKAAR